MSCTGAVETQERQRENGAPPSDPTLGQRSPAVVDPADRIVAEPPRWTWLTDPSDADLPGAAPGSWASRSDHLLHAFSLAKMCGHW